MFTGLVQEIGSVARAWRTAAGRRFVVKSTPSFSGNLETGDSVMVNGCCQTVEKVSPGSLTFTAVPETLAKSTLGSLRSGSSVNLEGAVRADQGLGGHIVTGHVDTVGVIQKVSRGSGGYEVGIECPREFMRFIAPKGSIAVDGMSLTVASVSRFGFAVALIPHTLKNTIAAGYRRGTRVNLEMDIVARYVQRLAGADS